MGAATPQTFIAIRSRRRCIAFVLIGTPRVCAAIGTRCKLALTAVTRQHLTGLIARPPDELIELADQLRTEAHQNWRRSWR
jgi:hypothetical protein